MISNINLMDYLREIANSYKFQISAVISFGIALWLIWLGDSEPTKIGLTILFLFALSMFFISLIEKIFYLIYKHAKKLDDWNSLTPQEIEFVSYYIKNNTKTQYVPAYNGTYTDSGIINPLIKKDILYIASSMSEFRGESWMTMEQHFPFNIHDKAFKFFSKKLKI